MLIKSCHMELQKQREASSSDPPVQSRAHPTLPCRESYSRQRTSCSGPSAQPARTGCGKGGAACGSTCGGTTRTPSRMTAAGRPPRPQRRYLQPKHRQLSPAQLPRGPGLGVEGHCPPKVAQSNSMSYRAEETEPQPRPLTQWMTPTKFSPYLGPQGLSVQYAVQIQ